MDIRKGMEKMGFQEKKIMLALTQMEVKPTVDKITQQTNLDQATVMRAALNLSENGFVELIEEKSLEIKLTSEGRDYVRDGLPERRMLVALASPISGTIDEVAARA
ncbi:MAG: hypothetical protein ABH852_01385, partial [Methanobacteriota archaeon]